MVSDVSEVETAVGVDEATRAGADSPGRLELKEALSETGNPALQALAESFDKMTPEQRAWGKLVGSLLESFGNDAVEKSFDSFAVENMKEGESLGCRERMLALFQAAECLGCDEAHYRLIRKMFVLANTRG